MYPIQIFGLFQAFLSWWVDEESSASAHQREASFFSFFSLCLHRKGPSRLLCGEQRLTTCYLLLPNHLSSHHAFLAWKFNGERLSPPAMKSCVVSCIFFVSYVSAWTLQSTCTFVRMGKPVLEKSEQRNYVAWCRRAAIASCPYCCCSLRCSCPFLCSTTWPTFQDDALFSKLFFI